MCSPRGQVSNLNKPPYNFEVHQKEALCFPLQDGDLQATGHPRGIKLKQGIEHNLHLYTRKVNLSTTLGTEENNWITVI